MIPLRRLQEVFSCSHLALWGGFHGLFGRVCCAHLVPRLHFQGAAKVFSFGFLRLAESGKAVGVSSHFVLHVQ